MGFAKTCMQAARLLKYKAFHSLPDKVLSNKADLNGVTPEVYLRPELS